MNERIGFLGGGNMARALIAALRRSGAAASTIAVGEPNAEVRAALTRDFGIETHADNQRLIADVGVLVLAVKPQDMARVLAPLRDGLAASKPLVISVAAGLRVADLARMLGADLPIVRSMPNRPALTGAGATGLYAPPSVGSEARQRAAGILGVSGTVVWVDDESAMDVVTTLSGSGPAYFFLLAETLAAAAVAQGLDPDAAQRLAAATLHGAGTMAAEDSDVAGMRAAVTSKGGTTEAALQSLATANFAATIKAAVTAAVARSRELSDRYGASH
jgi:pyrroline-5-carboxylate reductase